MKVNLKLLLVLMLTNICLFSAFSVGEDYFSLDIQNENITPSPASPGNDFTIQVRLYNNGDETATNLRAEIDYDNYFFLKSSKDNFNDVFDVCGGCSIDNTYYFVVDPKTPSGEYPIDFKFVSNDFEFEKTIFINVLGVPDIIIKSSEVIEGIVPNSMFELNLDVLNVGSGDAKNIKIIPKTDGFILKDENLIFIENIKPDEKKTISKTILTSSSLETEPQKLEFDILFKDQKSQDYEVENSIGVNVVKKSDLNLVSIKTSSEDLSADEKFDLTIRLENIGEGTANNVIVKVLSQEFLGEKLIYMGSIDEDEDVPAILTLSSSEVGNREIKLEVEYSDDLGTHKKEVNYFLDIKSKSNTSLFILLILVGLGAFGFYHFRKNKK